MNRQRSWWRKPGDLGLRPLKDAVRDKTGVNVANNEAFAVDPSSSWLLGAGCAGKMKRHR